MASIYLNEEMGRRKRKRWAHCMRLSPPRTSLETTDRSWPKVLARGRAPALVLGVEILFPAIRAQLGEGSRRQGTAVGSGGIVLNVGGRAHAGNDRADGGRRQAEAQGDLGHLLGGNVQLLRDALHAIPDQLLAAAAEVLLAEVAGGEFGFGRD